MFVRDSVTRVTTRSGSLYIITDNMRDLRGVHKQGCRCSERLRVKAGGGESLAHARWSEEMGYLRRGK